MAKQKLRRFTDAAKLRGDLEAWRRGRVVLGYIDGRRVIEMASESDQPLAAMVRGRGSRGVGDGQAAGRRAEADGHSAGPALRAHRDRSACSRLHQPAAAAAS